MTHIPLTQEQVERIVEGAPARHKKIMDEINASPERRAERAKLIEEFNKRRAKHAKSST